jgi:hypothetical protein
MEKFRCCLVTEDPGPWTAGVDDTADPAMVNAMHRIRDRLSYQMPIGDLIWALEAGTQIDSRTMLGGDLTRCLLSNAAARLRAIGLHQDPWPWSPLRQRIKDAWAVLRRNGVCIRTSSAACRGEKRS